MTSAPIRVAVIGAGIAGPVLALFLKSKGYDPVIYERTLTMTDGGLSLWYVISSVSTHCRGLIWTRR